MNWYLTALKKYAVFSGRSRRSEYWWFALISGLIEMALGCVDYFSGTVNLDYKVGLFSGLYSLAVLVPAIAVSVRRLHDTNRSGWWIFIACIPIVGTITYFVFMVWDSQPGPNRYGENPKGVNAGGVRAAMPA